MVYAAVLAAGSSSRFGEDKVNKILGGKPVWQWSFDTLRSCPEIHGVGLVSALPMALTGAQFVVTGGQTRALSCLRALEALPSDATYLLVHDAARPFVNPSVVSRVIHEAQISGASSAAIPVTDTIREQLDTGLALRDRTRLHAMQTPQCVRVDALRQAFDQPNADRLTDELGLAESVGLKPTLVEGDPKTFKLTTPEDWVRAEAYLQPLETRTGLGYDIHAFSSDPARPLWLGGVLFEDERGLEGHSDADCVLHAIVDALLGSLALGDIGVHFPPTESQWKNAPSASFLRFAGELVRRNGYEVRNIDVTIVAQRPKIMVKAESMRSAIAEALAVDTNRVSIKATTNEGLGSLGRSEGIGAWAVATVAQTRI